MKILFSQIDSVSHLLCLSSADDIKTDYRAHYNCDAGIWKVISTSLDID